MDPKKYEAVAHDAPQILKFFLDFQKSPITDLTP
jgi:hypothetical protein